MLVGVVGSLYPGLPGWIASNFNGRGVAQGWMKRETFLLIILLAAHLIPLFVVATFYLVRFTPASMLNLPQKDYWIREESRIRLNDYLFNSSLWFYGGHILFFAGLFYVVSAANQQDPAHLKLGIFLTLILIYMVAGLGWVITLIVWLTKKRNGPEPLP